MMILVNDTSTGLPSTTVVIAVLLSVVVVLLLCIVIATTFGVLSKSRKKGTSTIMKFLSKIFFSELRHYYQAYCGIDPLVHNI